jgi:glycolate oxidase FAD binding subunit
MLDRLTAELGADVVGDGAASRIRIRGRAPAAVIAPASAEQAARALALCSTEGWTVECAGAGTWLQEGRADRRVDVVITTERMTGILDYEPADLVVSVAAGRPLATLQAALLRNRQHVPVDPPGMVTATVGGMIASASAGPTRYGLGTPRDHVLGIELVTGDGRVLRLGGRVVKNVAGYDLVRLIVGSRGSLGLITQAHLRLRALPEYDTTVAFLADEPEPLVELAASVHVAWPTAVELIAPTITRAICGEEEWLLLVRCAGNRDYIIEALRRVCMLWPANCQMLHIDDAWPAWTTLADLEAAATVLIRVAGPPAMLGRMTAVAQDVTTAVGEPEHWLLAAHAGSGIVRLWRCDEPGPVLGARLAAAVDTARAMIESDRGTVLVTVAPDGMPESFDPLPCAEAERRLMRGVKAVFDPAGILAPGRFAF